MNYAIVNWPTLLYFDALRKGSFPVADISLYGIAEDTEYRRRLGGSIFVGRHPHRRVNTAEIERILHTGLMSPDRRPSEFNAAGGPQITTVGNILTAAGIDIDWNSAGGQRYFQFMSAANGRGESITRESCAAFFRRFLDQEFLPANGQPRQRSSLQPNPAA